MSEIAVTDVPDRSRYEARVAGEVAGFVDYQRGADGLVLVHTEVDDPYEGQGVGSDLVRGVLDNIAARGETVAKVTCPFITTWLRRHPDYAERVGTGAPG
jgi:predicted GNAT family acetyltransferase